MAWEEQISKKIITWGLLTAAQSATVGSCLSVMLSDPQRAEVGLESRGDAHLSGRQRLVVDLASWFKRLFLLLGSDLLWESVKHEHKKQKQKTKNKNKTTQQNIWKPIWRGVERITLKNIKILRHQHWFSEDRASTMFFGRYLSTSQWQWGTHGAFSSCNHSYYGPVFIQKKKAWIFKDNSLQRMQRFFSPTKLMH